MVGGVQLGVLAACVVLFVPMGMAGWHLSRNKMLFFSGALFITLAVGVHLTPYFPSIYDALSSLSSSVDRTSSRDSLLACDFQRLGRSDASDLLNGSWVVVAGDSQERLMALSLLSLVLDSDDMEVVKGDLFKRHSDYRIVMGQFGMKLDFIWAPYVANLTGLMTELKRNGNYPDVLVMGSGLWHMLHITNSSDYGVSLQLLRNLVVSLAPISPSLTGGSGSVSIRSPHFFWVGMPRLINSMLNTEEKRLKMSDAMLSAYDTELYQSKLLRQWGGGPLILLDVESLGRNCGTSCTVDGMHYDGIVYEAAVHVMLNALLIESHQKL
ncbi:hypothetical protein CK203_034315 [Vitis vinifera]|uniref:PC-Esterase n=1 Tax=Vitis vinifera TaxID=29760 RepID=A0A438INN4_VITVI|nr:hypothetical protein CK203_034315 [Vitis vinifera]